MKYRKLGNTNIDVSVLALGCWPFAGDFNWGAQEDADSIATVHAALDAGVNLFDTAEGYGDGRSEEVLGRALKGRRSEAVIATKVSQNHLAPDEIAQACERSLKFLQTDYIDLYQIHWPGRIVPLEESWATLEKLREQGKVRALGVCNFGVGDLSDLLAVGRPQANQLPYSLLWRAIEYQVQPLCVEQNIGMLCYMPLMQGLLVGKFANADEVPVGRARTRHFSQARSGVRHGESGAEQETFATVATIRQISERAGLPMSDMSLAWVLQRQAVTSVLAGARNPQQLLQNIQATNIELEQDVMAELDRATQALKEKLGTNPDMYQAANNSRFR